MVRHEKAPFWVKLAGFLRRGGDGKPGTEEAVFIVQRAMHPCSRHMCPSFRVVFYDCFVIIAGTAGTVLWETIPMDLMGVEYICTFCDAKLMRQEVCV